MKKIFSLLLMFLPLLLFSQRFKVHFNHIFLSLDSSDIMSIRNNPVVKNIFGAVEYRETKRENDEYAGLYIYGENNYFEFLNDKNTPKGYTGLGFYTETFDELANLTKFAKSTTNFIDESKIKRTYVDTNVLWYNALWLMDSVLYKQDSVLYDSMQLYTWIMAYHPNYFNYNNFTILDKVRLTNYNCLKPFESQRKGKILKDFSGIRLKLTVEEKLMFVKFMNNIGYSEKGIFNRYFDVNGFKIIIETGKMKVPHKCLKTLYFNTNKQYRKQKMTLAPTIQLSISGKKGKIDFIER